MKILHLASERESAQIAARAVRGLAQNVTLTWARTAASALQSLQRQRDTAAVIIEVQAQSCTGFVEQLRALDLTMPVVAVTESTRLEGALDAFNAGVDGYVVAGPSIESDLLQALTAAIDRDRRRRRDLTQALLELDAERDRVRQESARADEAVRQAEERRTSELAAVQSEHERSLAKANRIGTLLQQRLLELEAAEQEANRRHAAECADLQMRYEGALEERAAFEQHAGAVRSALEQAIRERDEEAAARGALARTLAEAQSAAARAATRAAEELNAASARQSALEQQLQEEQTGSDRLRQTIDQLQADIRALDETAHARAEECARLDALVVERDQQLHAQADRHRAEDEERRAAIAALHANLADAVAGRTALGEALAQTNAALEETRERASRQRAAAEEREALLEHRLAQETDRRNALEERLVEVQAAAQEAARHAAAELASASARAVALEHDLDRERDANRHLRQTIDQLRLELYTRDLSARAETDRHLAVEAESQSAIADLQANLAEAAAGRTALAEALAWTNAALEDSHERAARERAAANARQITLGEQLAQETDRRTRLEERLADVQAAAQEASCRHAAQLSDLQARYDGALDEYAALERHAADGQAAAAARQRMLEGELDAGRTRLAALVADHDRALREQAERQQAAEERGRAALTEVRAQLERSRHERRRLFERAPYAWCRCAPDGAIVEANHAFVAMFGFRRNRDLRDLNLVAAAQNRTGDLQWLLDRARTTGRTETVETEWTIEEGRRLIVRLQALAADEAIDIVAEDITGVRNLQAQLRQARRMEAVGRVASEVAMTCDALLSDVARGAHEWLAGADCDEAVQRYVERLLVDVTRAAGFMRQLEIYGREQVRALEPVSARRVLRNLAPVLNRIIGDQIALVLPKSGGSFDVEVDAERLERVFINVAGFARQRISEGGQVRIDLATTAIGRRFAARYSNVRPGDHVLITVTELPAARGAGAVADRPSRTDHPGVDLGVLVDLIASCGGHLWLEAQPAGNMVLKIHLPKASVQAAALRGGLLSKLVRTMPAVGARA